jgi:hypothetical protein
MKIKPGFGLIQEITGIWEKMRPTDVSESEKKTAVELIMSKASGLNLNSPHDMVVDVSSQLLRCLGKPVSRVKRPVILSSIIGFMALLKVTSRVSSASCSCPWLL